MEVVRELEQPNIWDNPERAQELGRERARLEQVVNTLSRLATGLTDAGEFLQMAKEDGDVAILTTVAQDLAGFEGQLADLEFQRMFSGEINKIGRAHV